MARGIMWVLHAFFGLGLAAGIAEVAWTQGDVVWNAHDLRLLKGFEFTARYNASVLATFPDQAEPWEPSGAELIERTDRTNWYNREAITQDRRNRVQLDSSVSYRFSAAGRHALF